MNAHEAHVAGDVVGRDKTEFNIGRATIISLDRRVFFALVGLLVLIGLAAIILSSLGRTAWATWQLVDDNLFGIAVAEFTVGGELKEAPQGAEMSRLIYTRLESDLKQAGLDNRVMLTKVGALRNDEEATQAGDRVHADIVLWGWVPEFAQESIVPNFTLIGEQVTRSDTSFIDSLNLIVTGPGTIRLNQLSGRATTLSRFVIGIVYLRDERSIDYSESLKMFTLGAQELEQDLKQFTELALSASDIDTRVALEDAQLATRKSLAVFYTLQGVSFAALDRPDDALASYETALTFDDTYPRLHVALGNHYYVLRNYEEAVTAYQRALDLDENAASAYYGLGVVNFELHDYATAISALQRAIELARTDNDYYTAAQAYLSLGYSYAAQGQTQAALLAFREILENPAASDHFKQTAREQIAALERSAVIPTPATTPTLFASSIPTGGAPFPTSAQTATLFPTPLPTKSPMPTSASSATLAP